MSVVRFFSGDGLAWLGGIFNCLMIYGAVRGREGMRTILIGLSVVSLVFGGLGLLFSLGVALSSFRLAYFLAVFVGGLGVLQSVYFIWCLKQSDVQSWMFKRSLGNVDGV